MRKLLLIFLFVSGLIAQASAQDRTVSGNVTSEEDGSTLPGVTVVLKGTTTGTTTDLDGNYKLSVPTDGGTLVYSFVGLATQEVEIGSRSVIDLVMQPDAKQLSEVVVTALGVARETKALGYSVQSVDGSDMNKAREQNIVNSLAGKVAGIQVTSSGGAVGSSSRVVLRGASSITGNNEPLYVVDGIPINNTNYGNSTGGGGFDMAGGVADINPDDVESMTVLKGANAAALYGARASNGVILITTKSGKKGDGLGISFNSSVQFNNPLKIPSFQNSYGQGNPNYFQFVDGQNGSGDGIDESWGMPLDVGLEAIQFGSIVDQANNGGNGGPQPWVSRPDNFADFYETGTNITNNIAFTGGNDAGVFRASFTNAQVTGMVPNTDNTKNTVALSAKYNFTDKLYSNFSVNYIKNKSDNMTAQGYDNANPVQQMIWSGRQVDVEALKDWQNLPLSPEGTAAAGTPLNWNTIFQNNPFWVQDINTNTLDRDRVIGNLKVGYKFTDWLTVQARTGTDFWNSKVTSRAAKGSNNFPEGNYYEIHRRWYEINSELLVMINKSINEDLDFNINFGGNQMKQVYDRIYGEAEQLQLGGVYNVSNVLSGVTPLVTNTFEERRINSVYFSGGLSFRNYLFFEFSGRNDWSSVLPTENNSFFYPSASLSAVLTDALNVQSDVLSFLKIRGSWAQVGGETALDPYALQQTYSFRDNPWGSTLLLYNPDLLNNPALLPESTTSIEFGVDARFFNGRVNLEATYFDTKNTDLLVQTDISAASGYQAQWNNVAEMSNSGFEIQLGARVLDMGDLKWDVDINYAKIKNEVVSLGGLESLTLGTNWSASLQAREGEPYGVFFGPAFEKTDAGRYVYNDGLPVLSDENEIFGSVQPDWTGGINNTISYKGITLSALVDAKMGGVLHSMTYTWGMYAGVLDGTLPGRENGIIGDGVMLDGETGDYVENNVVVTGKNYNQNTFTNDVVETAIFDASYVKLRQIQLGYTIPNKLLGNFPLRDISLSVVGRNLAILYSKVPHIDPETGFSSENSQQGQEFGQIPTARSIGFNINFKL